MQRSVEIEYSMRYARCGAVVIVVDPPSFRPQEGEPRGILTFTAQDRREQIQLIIDLRRAVDLLTTRPDVDPHRIAYLGISYGGAMGGLLAAVEDRLEAFVLVVGDGGLVTHVTSPGALTAPADEFYVEYGAWIDEMWPIEPIHFIAHASPTPILFQNALQDQFSDPQDALRYQEAAGEPRQVIWYDSEHWPLPDAAFTDSAKWLQPYIGAGRLYLLPSPNYHLSVLVIDRLLITWLFLTLVSLVFLIWHQNRGGRRFRQWHIKWFVLVAFLGSIGVLFYLRSQKSEQPIG